MAEISEAAKTKAFDLFGAEMDGSPASSADLYGRALARFIQEVSSMARDLSPYLRYENKERLESFILPEPVDPLAEILKEYENRKIYSADRVSAYLRAELGKRGLEIREKSK